MADITTSTTISENDHQIVMAFQYQYIDGGNEDAVTKVDVSALTKNSAGDSCAAVRIVEAWWTIYGMTVQVEADATVDVIIMHLDENQSGYQDFSIFGGLPKTTTYCVYHYRLWRGDGLLPDRVQDDKRVLMWLRQELLRTGQTLKS